MKSIKIIFFALMPLVLGCASSHKKQQSNFTYQEDFNAYNNRNWINEELWAIPIEDWKLENGKVACTGNIADMRLNLLTHLIEGKGEFTFSVNMGLTGEYKDGNASGLRIGVNDNTDNDVRSLCYFGKGIDIGVHTDGFLFIDSVKTALPEGFNWTDFKLKVDASNAVIKVACTDSKGKEAVLENKTSKPIEGLITLIQNFEGNRMRWKNKGKVFPKFFFDNILLTGTNVVEKPKNSFGPILFSMYTLSNKTLKLTAQMPPLGEKDNKQVNLEVKKEGKWEKIQTVAIEKNARIAPFRIENWEGSADIDYRIAYTEKLQNAEEKQHFYEGTIRKAPTTSQLSMGGLTCQFGSGFPYRPLSENLAKSNPDLLFFSGDQIYEPNGGYSGVRFPADRSIVNYLGKWYMFGWAFGDVMRDRPTITLPDDHEVFQGNLWGNGGEVISLKEWNKNSDGISGFVQPLEMIDVVTRTNCSHIPDAYDPTPIKNNMAVYYTGFEYGNVSFAIVADRTFKSGPENVATWKGRKDQMKEKLKDPSILEKEGLTLLGKRQMDFLEEWSNDWDGKQIKVILSQTLFTNLTTHYGRNKEYWAGDLDSGGWPKSSRDSVLYILDKCRAFHICGDQHLGSVMQYGVKDYCDASWAFCTPAITTGYPRRFMPDLLGWKTTKKPAHNLPNTGAYEDGFDNKNYVYAVGNPDDIALHENRYQQAELKASGYGMIYFDSEKQQVKCESIRFLADFKEKDKAQFTGWPVTIDLKKNKVVND